MLVSFAFSAHGVTFVAEPNVPFNYSESNQVTGVATEIANEMAKRAKLEAAHELLKVDEALMRAQRDKDTCMLSVARTESRDKLYLWIGPIGVNRWAVFGTSDFKESVTRVEDLRKYRIGGVTKDAKLEYLAQYAVTNISGVKDDLQNPPRLALPAKDPNRIDLWFTGAYTARKFAREAGVANLKMVYQVQEIPLYIACSPESSRATTKALAEAYATMSKDGSIKRINDRYIKKFAQ